MSMRERGRSKMPSLQTSAEVMALLRADNPHAPMGDLRMYTDAFLLYRTAAENVARLGSVVAHPKTSAPMPNPYLPVMAAQTRTMQSLRRVAKTDRLWLAD